MIQRVVMRWSPAIAVAVLAALVAAGHVAAADGAREQATPRAQRVGCDRAVGTFGRREVFIGTVGAVRAVVNYADPDGLEPFRNPDGPGYGFKAPPRMESACAFAMACPPAAALCSHIIPVCTSWPTPTPSR